MVTVRITTQVVQCDRCGEEGDAKSFELETGRLTTRRRVQFDACQKCQANAPLAAWVPLGRTVRRGRSERPVITLSEVDQMKTPPRAAQVRSLAEAVASYVEARAQTDVTKSVLREESRILEQLLSANGNIFVRDVGRQQVERALGRDLQPLAFGTLDQLFSWCRRNRWMRAGTDPLRGVREPSAQPLPSPLDEVESGTCTSCHSEGFVAPIAIRPDGAAMLHHRLCRRCRGRATLAQLTPRRDRQPD